jgi:hypothetical protein
VASKEKDSDSVPVPMIYTGAADSASGVLVSGQAGPDLGKLFNKFEIKLPN